MPISDIFIAKRVQSEIMQWQLFDVYKINHEYDIEIGKNGMILALNDDQLKVVGANFSSARRQNLKGTIVNCGLVVNIILLHINPSYSCLKPKAFRLLLRFCLSNFYLIFFRIKDSLPREVYIYRRSN